MREALTLYKTTIAPGEEARVELPAGRLPTGVRLSVPVQVYHAVRPGPVVLVLAGMHGDEVNGIEIVRRAIGEGLFRNLEKGSVLAVPALNVYGLVHFIRDAPDGRDVNRSFPGATGGSLASRLARMASKHLLPHIDFGIDFHSGGNDNYNFPQIRYARGHEDSRRLAEAFGAPFVVGNRPLAKSLRRIALAQDKPILVYEGGENRRFDTFAIEKGLQGLVRLLASEGMLPLQPSSGLTRHFTKTTWLRAPRAGFFHWTKGAGQPVQAGERIGLLADPLGVEETPILAHASGWIIGHNNTPVVHGGDALFHIAYS